MSGVRVPLRPPLEPLKRNGFQILTKNQSLRGYLIGYFIEALLRAQATRQGHDPVATNERINTSRPSLVTPYSRTLYCVPENDDTIPDGVQVV